MKNKTKFLLTTLFILVAFLLLGTTNVNATTVIVETADQLRDALDGVKEVDGSTGIDTDTTVVELGKDIKLSGHLDICPVTNITLDLKGHTIDTGYYNREIHINYGISGNNKAHFSSGSLTIKDSSDSKTGKIMFYNPVQLRAYNGDDSIKNFKLIIEGGKFYSANGSTIFELDSSKMYKNVTFDFQVKDGYFETSTSQAILLHANDLDTYNVTLNVNYDKLTFKGLDIYGVPRLLCSNDRAFTLGDIVSSDSNISIKNTTDNETKTIENRTLSAISSDPFEEILPKYDTIEITKAEGFDVSNVTLNENYGYTTATAKTIIIKNNGTSSLQIKNVSVDSANFEVVGTAQPTVTAGNIENTSFKIKPKTGLNAGTYTGVITVTDMAGKTYTANVTLTVARKPLGDISVSKDGWTYDGTAHTGYTKSGLDSVSSDKYLIEYSIKNADEWSTTVPKIAGTYTIRLTITDSNLEEKSVESDFTIEKNNTQIKIIANSDEVTYDSFTHSDSGYKIYYGDTEITTGTLPTGDHISAGITGSVIDVKDTVTGNNVVSSYSLENEDSYSNITTTNGTLTVKPITTEIVVTADSDTKAYDGSALTKNSFTYTDGVLELGDELTATISGSQTYVGTSNNTVSEVKVMRGDKDITSNYTFGTHVNGTLTVTAVDQPLSIADQYVRVNGTLLTSELEAALTGAKGNVSFEKKSGTAGEYNNETIGGFLAGSSEGTVVMTVKATSFDANSDGTPEYNATEQDFNIHVVTKETVTISGITDNQEFTYDGHYKTPIGTINVTDNKVEVSDLEVSYAGTGSTSYNSTIAPDNAGTYKVTYKVPNSNANYAGEATFNFTIKKLQLSKVTLNEDSFEYTGEEIRIEQLNNWDAMLMSVTGDYNKTNVGNYTITVSLNEEFKKNYEWTDGTTSNLTLNWSIIKADPDFDIPTNLTGLKGQTLNDIGLPAGFTWDDASTALIVGTHTYKATYTPEDTANYNVINNIDITVVTKNIFNVTTSVVGGNGTISTSYANVVEGSTKEITFTPNTGYMIDKVTVNGTPVTVTNNKLTLTVDENKDVKVSYKKIPFTITVVDTEGATVDPNGAVVNYGDSKQFTIYADYGYNFVKVLVNGVDKTAEMVGDTLTLNNITASMEIKVVVEKINYEVIEGANQEYTITKDTEAKFRIDAEYGLFMQGGKVYVDDELVEEDNYTSEEGSTIITLKQAYVDTLAVGKHTLKVTFADGGVATTNFTVAKVAEKPTPDVDNNNTNTENKEEIKEEDNSSNPKTFDNIMVYVAIAIMSVVGLGATVVIKKKQAK